jgi:hypothetical protein
MIAGVISVIFTYPLDMTRAQLAVLRRQKDPSSNMSFYRVMTDNYRNRVCIFEVLMGGKEKMGILNYYFRV